MEFFTFTYRDDTFAVPDLPHHLSMTIRRLGTFYELDLLEHLAVAIGRGGVWVDVGANIGNHTMYFSRYLADVVISLEPHPDTFGTLEQTISRNALSNVVAYQVGASEQSRAAALSLPVGFENNPGSYQVSEQGEVPISLETLDSLLGESGTIRVIKIDVEGHELPALRGATKTIGRYRPHLVVEAHTDADLAAILDLVTPFGYRVVVRGGPTPTYHLAPWNVARFWYFRAGRKWRHLKGIWSRAVRKPGTTQPRRAGARALCLLSGRLIVGARKSR